MMRWGGTEISRRGEGDSGRSASAAASVPGSMEKQWSREAFAGGERDGMGPACEWLPECIRPMAAVRLGVPA